MTTQPPPAIDIDQLRELAKAAQPAPWSVRRCRTTGGDATTGYPAARLDGPQYAPDYEDSVLCRPDARLIVAMRNSFEALLQELEELRAMRAAVHKIATRPVATAFCLDHDMRQIEKATR